MAGGTLLQPLTLVMGCGTYRTSGGTESHVNQTARSFRKSLHSGRVISPVLTLRAPLPHEAKAQVCTRHAGAHTWKGERLAPLSCRGPDGHGGQFIPGSHVTWEMGVGEMRSFPSCKQRGACQHHCASLALGTCGQKTNWMLGRDQPGSQQDSASCTATNSRRWTASCLGPQKPTSAKGLGLAENLTWAEGSEAAGPWGDSSSSLGPHPLCH